MSLRHIRPVDFLECLLCLKSRGFQSCVSQTGVATVGKEFDNRFSGVLVFRGWVVVHNYWYVRGSVGVHG